MVAQVEPSLKPRLVHKLPRGIVQVFTATDRSFPTEVMVNAMRAASQGTKVMIVQFFQGGISQGVGSSRKLVENLHWLRADVARIIDLANPCLDPQEQSNILALWSFIRNALFESNYQLFVLDEVTSLIPAGLVTEEVLLRSIEERDCSSSVIITGMNVPPNLLKIADQVTHKRSG